MNYCKHQLTNLGTGKCLNCGKMTWETSKLGFVLSIISILIFSIIVKNITQMNFHQMIDGILYTIGLILSSIIGYVSGYNFEDKLEQKIKEDSK